MPDNPQLQSVARNIALWQEAMKQLTEAEATVERLKALILRLRRTDIPDAMMEAETTSFTTIDGLTVKVDPVFIARLPPRDDLEKREAAFEKLKEYGLESIVTVDVGASFVRGHLEQAKELLAGLQKIEQAKPYLLTDVHWMTLQKSLRERASQHGTESVDSALFNVFIGREARIVER